MRILVCGYLGDTSEQFLTPTAGADLSGSAVQLCTGGFGQWGIICSGDFFCRSGVRQVDTELATGVRAAALGWEHVVVLSAEGTVSSYAVPGVDTDDREVGRSPVALPDKTDVGLSISEPVAAIAAGEQHSLAATCSGDLYAWGSNQSSQLGTGDESSQRQPQHVAAPCISDAPQLRHHIVQVACGARHSAAVTAAGALLCWGWCLHGQCGGGEVVDCVPRPQLVPMPQQLRCKQVAAGLGHTAACFTDGSAYAWGLNTDGQLGLGLGHDRSCASPQLVDAPALEEEDVAQVACGARHTVLLTASGKVFACGWGKWGQLGMGTTDSQAAPMQISLPEGVSISDAACGWWSTMLLVECSKPPAAEVSETVEGAAASPTLF